MDFLKKWFNKVIGWIATPIAKTFDKIAEYALPVVAKLRGFDKVEWSASVIGKGILSLIMASGAALLLGAVVVMSIAGLTLLLGLLLPLFLANALAVVAVLYVGHLVIQEACAQRAAEIVVEVPLAGTN